MSRTLILGSLSLVAALLLTGCEAKVTTENARVAAPAKLTAREVVDKTIAAYRSCFSYSDQGRLRLRYQLDGETLEDIAPLQVQYALPNKLRVAAYQTEIYADGQHLSAQIRDDATQNIDGQVMRRPLPAKLTLDDIYSDEVLRDTLQRSLGRYPVQLELLLGDAPLLDLVKPDAQLTLLAAEDYEGDRCHRIEAKLADGAYVFWIDEAKYLLRRIDYPAAALLPDLAGTPGVSQLTVSAELRHAKFDQDLPAETFAFAPPAGAKLVQFFVLPPQALPSNLFGKKLADFTFTQPDGEALTAAQLAGRPALLVWFSDDPTCAWGLKQFSDALASSPVRDKVAAYVVAIDGREITNEQVAARLKEWEVNVPLLRDYDLVGRDTFGIRNAPSLVALDGTGVVQIFEEGIRSQLPQTLPVVLERLVAGEDLAGEVLKDARQTQEQYAQDLATASGNRTQTTVVELTRAEPVAAREPEHFTRERLWTTADKGPAEPGNLLVIDDPEKPRIFVLDGHRTVVELDAAGQTLQKHALDIPEDAGVTYLRTAVDKQGKRWFVGSAPLGKQLFVFDEDWKTTLRYPPDDQPHEGLSDVRIADLEADGTPELYVGFWNLIGVQGVTLEGKREWTNRVIPTVLSIALTPANELGWRKILASGDRGSLFRLNQYGLHDPKLEVPQRQVHRLATAPWEPPLATTYCGISHLAEGKLLAIGLDAELREVWTYNLPGGDFQNQIEYVTAGRFRDDAQGEWVMAGPDGVVHLVSADGEFSDTFAVGETLTGIAAAKLGDARVVLTASKSGVQAWKLQAK